MPIVPATRMNRVQPAATLKAGETARRLVRQGKDVIDLSQSSPHHTTPRHIIDAGVKALQDGLTNISTSDGLLEFRKAIADKLLAHNDLQVDPEGDILVTPGSKMGLYESINAYVDRGDEVLIVEPNWVSFRQQVELSEGIPIAVALSEEEEYALTYDVLERQVSPRSKMVIINNPNNPTGRVYRRSELEAVAHFCQEHDLLALCDETYEYFLYDSNRHITLASLPGMWQRTLTSFTFTKAYAMAGWRLGCIVGPASLIGPLSRINEHTASFVSPFIQMAGVEALQRPQDHLTQWRLECDQLRTYLADCLNRVPGVYCPQPPGATFMFPRSSSSMNSEEMAQWLVEEEGVVVTPGAGFGESGESHFRIALMRSPADRVVEGGQRIARALAKL